jgi:type I restriction enzyme, S subunit
MPRTSWEKLSALRLQVPTPKTQREIADFLDAETARIDALIEKKQRIIALSQERYEAAVDLILAEWPLTTLRRIASRVDVGIAEAATHAYADDGVPLIRSQNIRRNELDLTDLLFVEPWFAERNRSKRLNSGDIITVRTGNAGVSAVVPIAQDGSQCFTQLMTTLLPRHLPELICTALNATYAKKYFGREGWGSAQANISVPLLANAPVPSIPPQHQGDVLKRLRREWNTSRALLRLEQGHIQLLRERRQTLIATAVTGELDLTGPA